MTDTHTPDSADEQVVDAEIIEEKAEAPVEASAVQAQEDQSTVLTSLDELIKSHIASLDRLAEEQKKMREMLADGFNNDASFKEASDKAKEATKAKSAARQQIINRPGVIEIANKLKNVSSEIKEKQASLSDYLLEYQRMANVNQVEGYDGEVREIVHVARLVKKAKPDK